MEMSIHGVFLAHDQGQFSTDKVRKCLETLARGACETDDANRKINNVAILDGAKGTFSAMDRQEVIFVWRFSEWKSKTDRVLPGLMNSAIALN